MRLREWTINLPADAEMTIGEYGWIPNVDLLIDRAIHIVKEDYANDYVIPAIWDCWVIENVIVDEISFCVTRLSSGCAYPTMKSGYCYVDDNLEKLQWEPGNEVEMYVPNGTEYFLFQDILAGNNFNIWLCGDGKYRAQLDGEYND